MNRKKYLILSAILTFSGALLLTSCLKKGDVHKEQTREKESSTEKASGKSESAAEATETTAITEEEKTEEIPEITAEDILEYDAGTIVTEDELACVEPSELFTAAEIEDTVFERMKGISFGDDCTTKREDLRYLRILHTGFDGETHIGEIVCHRDIAEDLLDIFRKLYEENYPIEKVRLVDEYGGDDELSMADNNSSCFNFRNVAQTTHLSEHAYGRAIDINPLYNPYITSSGYTPLNAGEYVDRSRDFPYKIDEKDLCCRLFTEHGFTWGGDWNTVKDYQHFEKGR